MNKFQEDLFNDLMHLVDDHESFYYKDHVKDDVVYRIFNYRLVSYSDYVKSPVAFESRGIMFKMNGETPSELSAMPMEKFFNVNENPYTENLDFTKIVSVTPKFDGSLISTFMHNGKLALKSKGSLSSIQAVEALAWISTRSVYLSSLYRAENDGYTVNLEWVSPMNRIVILYDYPELVVLNIRDKATGEYIDIKDYNEFLFQKSVFNNDIVIHDNFVKDAYSEEDIEGYILEFENGQRAKLKTEWYCKLHRSLDDVTNVKKLTACILDECVDDLKSMFHDNEYLIKHINMVERMVDREYNHLVDTIEDFHNTNKDLERKRICNCC